MATVVSHRMGGDSRPFWDDVLWDPLITSIQRKNVIPIIGPELCVARINGRTEPMIAYVVRELCEELGIDQAALGPMTLNDVVRWYVRDNRVVDELYARISNIVGRADAKPTRAIELLARITDFKLYLTLSFDTLLEDAIAEARPVGRRPLYVSYTPNLMPDCDLPSEPLTTPLVYYLMGRHSWMPEYCISDDDLLEFVCGIQSSSSPKTLLGELKRHNLLFLGGNFPDWLLRILLRLSKQRRLSLPRETVGAIEILADSSSRSDPNLVNFLGDFSSKTRFYGSHAEDFVEELWTRWSARNPRKEALIVPEAGVPFIFISFAREDLEAAKALSARLAGAGIATWMEMEQFGGGEFVDSAIARRIGKCSLFIPLISRQTESRLRDTYFRREWEMAVTRGRGNADSVVFILPTIVDSTDPGDFQAVPPCFHGINMLRASGGRAEEDYVERVRSLLGGDR